MQDITPHEPLIFIDLETSGANLANDRIIEIGLLEVDSDGVREWSSLVNPQRPIPPFISTLTGIDMTMVESAPTFEQLAPGLLERLRGRLFIAHNARFDYGFLKHEFRRLGIDFRATTLCTVKLSRKLFPGHQRYNLDTLVERYAIPADDRHRALADARILWRLWQRWHDLLSEETIREAIDAITGRPELPPQLDPAFLDDLPEAPGAYALFDKDNKLLLAKRATNIRRQVFAHFLPTRRDTPLVRNVQRIESREAAGELGARLHEFELTSSARTIPADLCAWRLVRHADENIHPELVFARDLDFARTDNLFGLYSSRREAVTALRKLAEAHDLCHNLLGLGNGKEGEACVAYRQKACRGACVGKEALSLHSARLLAAIAKHHVQPWPYAGPIALIERDEFGMREDILVIDAWRYLGSAHDAISLQSILEDRGRTHPLFDPDIYRIVRKALRDGKVRIQPLTENP